MRKGLRIAIAVALVLMGILVALFFGALSGIADCSDACKQRGERAVAFGLAAGGLGVAAMGATFVRGTGRAVGVGLVTAGALAAIASAAEIVRSGAGILSLAVLAVGIAAAVAGAFVLRRPR